MSATSWPSCSVTIDSETKLPVFDFAFAEKSYTFTHETRLYTDVYVTVTSTDGKQLRTAELFGDSDDRKVIFDNGDISEFVGKEVYLSFEMKDARLYAFGVRKP